MNDAVAGSFIFMLVGCIISFILGLAVIITFFNMNNNLKSINFQLRTFFKYYYEEDFKRKHPENT